MADNTQEDLSMEDILSSIKNILVDDTEEQERTSSQAVEQPVAQPVVDDFPQEEEEIFDLSANMRVDSDTADAPVLDLTASIASTDAVPSLGDFSDDEPIDLSEIISDVETSIETDISSAEESITSAPQDDAEPFYTEDETISIPYEDAIDLSQTDELPMSTDDLSEQATDVAQDDSYITEVETPVFEMEDSAEPVFMAETEAAVVEPVIEEVSEPDVEQIYPMDDNIVGVSEDKEPDASDNMLNNFAQMFTPTSPRTDRLGDGNKTLETLVKEVIADEVSAYVEQNLENLATRDMIMAETSRQISSWVDNNLQKVVEDIVRQEIVRVMAKVGNN